MTQWYMLTFVGKDRAGIVANVTRALFEGGCNLGEASMARLGGNFTIMLMVQSSGSLEKLKDMMAPIAEKQGLRLHVDAIEGELHHHEEPDVRISVYGADRVGVVADVTGALAEAGLNILNLETDVGGTSAAPIYIVYLDGIAGKGVEKLEQALETLRKEKKLDANLTPIDPLTA